MNTPKKQILSSTPNLRDLGGIVTRDGCRIRKGIIYRSEQLSKITDAEMPLFENLGLKNIYDLRTDAERQEQPDRIPAGAAHIVVDVLADERQAGPATLLHLLSNPKEAEEKLGGGKIEQMFIKTYAGFVSLPSARSGYSMMFHELSRAENLPAIYHCTTGKDRTGWASAALLTLCGVSQEDVMQNYLLSNEYILPEYAEVIDKLTKAGVDQGILLSILGVRAEYLQAAFAEMQEAFGSIEDYFSKALKMDQTGQNALKSRFVEN